MILFLDFDGVLHPMFSREDRSAAENQRFSYAPRLETVLRDFPQVDIVISNDWRKLHTLEELRGFYSPDIAQRMVGVTPVINRNNFEVAYAVSVRHLEVPGAVENVEQEAYLQALATAMCAGAHSPVRIPGISR